MGTGNRAAIRSRQSLKESIEVKVLVAEDEPSILFVLEMFLKKWGYDVISACNGAEAWQILQEEGAPRLAILDWMMPCMQGVEICREVRKRTEQPKVYILLLTAKAQKADILAGLGAGADDYMTKPFDPEELRLCLEAGCRMIESRDSPDPSPRSPDETSAPGIAP